MPTNITIDLLRTPRGLKWAIPAAMVATPAYLFAMSVCATLVERGGPGYLNVLVLALCLEHDQVRRTRGPDPIPLAIPSAALVATGIE